MSQVNLIKRSSEDGKINIYIESDTGLGAYHDFLLTERSWCIDRINESNKAKAEESSEAITESEPQG